FAKGMELIFPGGSSKELTRMIKEHPAFMQPTAPRRPNPFMAEQFYGKGLHDYWAGKFDDAEKQFETALGYFKDDARYWYFLGLSRMAQKGSLKRDAAYLDSEEVARLDAKEFPLPHGVNSSHERVPG